MPLAKQDTGRYPRTYVFNTLGHESITASPAIAAVNSTVQGQINIPCGVKVAKVSVSWLTATLANLPSFNIVYNTVQALGSAQTYTQGNVVPNDNSYTNGAIGTLLGGSQVPNPALVTAFPNFQQIGGLGIPTNVAVDGQPLFAADVLLNTTNFPGASATVGGQGNLVPTNFDAVYPAGVYPYGVAQGMTNAANLAACFTLRATSPTTAITGLTVTLFLEPILLAETIQPNSINSTPGNLF